MTIACGSSPLLGALSAFTRWTPAEDAILARTYAAGGIYDAEEALPHRPRKSLYKRARKLGLSRRRRWTAEDDLHLRNLWYEGHRLCIIAKKLGRTQQTTYWRAQRMGLQLGVPEGFEYLSAAAERCGYAVTQLRPILAWAGVRIRRTLTRPGPSKTGRRFHFVDPLDVDDAVAAWLKTEPVEVAARRLGICPDSLRARLRRIGLPSNGRHLRVTESDIDRANAIAKWSHRNGAARARRAA